MGVKDNITVIIAVMKAARLLRQARRRVGMSQRDLARVTGMPQPAIARIERGAVTPGLDTLERLLAGVGMTLEMVPRPGIGVDRTLVREALELDAGGADPRRGSGRPSSGRLEARGGRWPASTGFRPDDVVRLLGRHGVRYVVIGGLAAVHRASRW